MVSSQHSQSNWSFLCERFYYDLRSVPAEFQYFTTRFREVSWALLGCCWSTLASIAELLFDWNFERPPLNINRSFARRHGSRVYCSLYLLRHGGSLTLSNITTGWDRLIFTIERGYPFQRDNSGRSVYLEIYLTIPQYVHYTLVLTESKHGLFLNLLFHDIIAWSLLLTIGLPSVSFNLDNPKLKWMDWFLVAIIF